MVVCVCGCDLMFICLYNVDHLSSMMYMCLYKVNGVYDKDPIDNSDAVKFNQITFKDILDRNIRVMDLTAITLCKENNLPIRIFNINNTGDLKKIVLGSNIGTIVKD